MSAAVLQNGKKADILITVDEINKASERFRGLSDVAEKSAGRATKTPHVDNEIIAQLEKSQAKNSNKKRSVNKIYVTRRKHKNI